MMLHTSLITDSTRKTWMVAMCGHTLSSDYFTSHLGGVVGESQIEFRGLPENPNTVRTKGSVLASSLFHGGSASSHLGA